MMQMLTIDRAASNAKPALLFCPGVLAGLFALVGSLLMLIAFPGPAMGQQSCADCAPDGAAFATENDEIDPIVVSPRGTLVIWEGGEAKSLEISLDTEPRPSSDVTITLSISSPDGFVEDDSFDHVTITPLTLTFTPENYDQAQEVQVSAEYDDDATGDIGAITLTPTGGFAEDVTVLAKTVNVTIREPRSPPVSAIEVTFSGDELTFAEGDSKDISVKLGAKPSSTVTVSLSKTNPDITLSKDSLSFDTSNWNTAQTVVVTAVADDDATDDSDTLSLSVTGGIIALDVVESIKVVDDDGSIVLDSDDTIELTEGGSDDTTPRTRTFTVKLGAAPASSAVLSISSADPGAVTVSPATLTFTADDYDKAQTVTVSAANDRDSKDEEVTITVSVVDGINATAASSEMKTVEVSDDDGEILLNRDPITITEGGTDDPEDTPPIFGVRLGGAPAASATVSVSSGDTGAVTVSPATLTFTMDNYDDEQMVTVAPVDDGDGFDESVDITLSVTDGYTSGMKKKPVVVIDDDREIVVSPETISFTEGGSAAHFTVKLGVGVSPALSATVSVSSKDVGAVTVSPATLTFTADNHDKAQTVTVTPVSDDDGTDEAVEVVLFSTAGSGYAAEAETKMIAVIDDDGKIVIDDASLSVSEGGSEGTFTVKLGAPPAPAAPPASDTVTVSVSSGAPGVVRVLPSTLTFAPDNYEQAQTVFVIPMDDDDTSNESATVTLSVATGGYTAMDETKTIEVIDDDGIVLDTSEIFLIERDSEGGGDKGSFYVSLGGAPASSATVSISSADPGAVTVSPSTLTFSSDDHAVSKKVTVTAEDDDDATDEEVEITLSSTGYTAPDMTMKVHVTDDGGGIVVEEDDKLLVITEGDGSGGTFTVGLDNVDSLTSNATLTLTIDDPEGRCAQDGPTCPITISPTTLTFGSGNHGTAQTVTVKALFDDDDMDNEGISIVISATAGMTAAAGRKEIKIEEPAEIPDGTIKVSPAGNIEIEESGIKGKFTVGLGAQPTSTVTVSISGGDDHVAISPRSLTFAALGWKEDDTREVVVTALLDDDASDEEFEITIAAEGGIKAKALTKNVKITDRFSGSTFIVHPLDALHVNEGETGILSVRLGLQPADRTTVSLSNTNDDITFATLDGDTIPSVDSLVFTLSNWNEAQIIVVSAAEDADTENDRDTITFSAEGFSDRRIDVLVKDETEYLPVKAYALALPSVSVQDSSTLRVHCKQDTPCFVMLDCTAQDDGSSFEGRIPEAIPAHGALTLTAADIERHTGASWSGKGRLGCALRSEERITAQVWTRSGDGVLVNNSAVLRSDPEGSGYRADIESIPSPDSPEESNLRIRCLAPDGEHCVGIRFSCFGDEGTMYGEGLMTVDRLTVFHLQSEDLAEMIGHRWTGMGLACEINSDHPFTVQVLTRTGGGGALVNNSATGRGRR